MGLIKLDSRFALPALGLALGCVVTTFLSFADFADLAPDRAVMRPMVVDPLAEPSPPARGPASERTPAVEAESSGSLVDLFVPPLVGWFLGELSLAFRRWRKRKAL